MHEASRSCAGKIVSCLVWQKLAHAYMWVLGLHRKSIYFPCFKLGFFKCSKTHMPCLQAFPVQTNMTDIHVKVGAVGAQSLLRLRRSHARHQLLLSPREDHKNWLLKKSKREESQASSVGKK